MGFHNLVNTQYFREAAIGYVKNGGRYTRAPRGSKDYLDFWRVQEERCQHGYKVGDLWIPGRYYFYLNFFPMWKVPDDVGLQAYEDRRSKVTGQVSKRTSEKILDFPRFHEMQYEWHMFSHIAWNGGQFMGISSPGGKHMCCGKTRGAGMSYMEAADGVYNFNFIPGSKSYYFASVEEYLTKDGILNKVQEGLDWINNTIPYWAQQRQKKYSTMHQKASFIDYRGEEMGSKSEIMGVTINDPNKGRGKRGRKVVFEEAGSFKNLKQTLEVTMGSMRDNDLWVGQVKLFGTGGEEGTSLEGLEDVFYHPEAWDMLAFPDVYEDGQQGECGFFIPSWRCNFVHADKDGNMDYVSSLESDNYERNKKKLSKDPKSLDRRKAEYPHKPSEMFNRLVDNGFNTDLCTTQLKYVESTQAIKSMLRDGKFVRNSTSPYALNGVEFVIDPEAKPINHYPHTFRKGDDEKKDFVDLAGCVTICEKPYIHNNGKVPEGMYFVVFDPYYKEDALDKTSLFDITVWKQPNQYDQSMTGMPVAWYTGRPNRLERCYETLFAFCDYYNCLAQGEIAGGGTGVINYAKEKRFLHKLSFEPEMLHNQEIAGKQKNRSYLMNMTTDRKTLGMTYLEQWHTEIRGVDDQGNNILNTHRLYKTGMLREMIKGGSMNADRISSAIIAMFELKENVIKAVNTSREQSNFFKRVLFSGGSSGSSTAINTQEYTSFT